MTAKLLLEYQDITEKIEIEKHSYLTDLIVSISEGMDRHEKILSGHMLDNHKQTKKSKSSADHETIMISLYSLRIALNCQLLLQDVSDFQHDISEDFKNIISGITATEFSYAENNVIVSAATDLVTALCPEGKYIIIQNILDVDNSFHYIASMVDGGLLRLFARVFCYYKQHGYDSAAQQLYHGMICLSEKRNPVNIHREIIASDIPYLFEKYPNLTCKICESALPYFENTCDVLSGDFYCFYSAALQILEKTDQLRKTSLKCYQIRRIVHGESSWLTVYPRFIYSTLTLCDKKQSQESQQYLLWLVNAIENEQLNLEDVDLKIVRATEGRALFLVAQQKIIENEQTLCEIAHYLPVYEKICHEFNDDPNEPLLKTYLSNNTMAAYYLESGNFLLAEQAFLSALKENPPKITGRTPSESQIKSNLLTTYILQNDINAAMDILAELYEIIDEEDGSLTEGDYYRIITLADVLYINNAVEADKDELKNEQEQLFVLWEELQSYDNITSLPYAAEKAAYACCAIVLLLNSDTPDIRQYRFYYQILKKLEENIDELSLNVNKKTSLYSSLYALAIELQLPEADKWLTYSAQLAESKTSLHPMTRAGILFNRALDSAKAGRRSNALKQTLRCISLLDDIWHPYVRYANDTRMLFSLIPVQNMFIGCYSILHSIGTATEAYESLLNYKALTSLAGRERNILFQNNQSDPSLLSEIHSIQDRIAALEASSFFMDTDAIYKEEERHLHQLEAEFSRQFPQKTSFTNITYKNVCHAMPNNCAVIEYYLSSSKYGLSQEEIQQMGEDNFSIFDVYILRKKYGICTLKKIVIENAVQILQDSTAYVEILQTESSDVTASHTVQQKETLNRSLYQQLIQPLKKYIHGYHTVYLAPDNALVNLPFEILTSSNGDLFSDRHEIIKIECARDFLFMNHKHNGTGSLIIGNPQYDISSPSDSTDKCTKCLPEEKNILEPLPFSEIEARCAAKHCCSSCLTGKAATKYSLLQAHNFKNIHIATHGVFDLSEESDALYSSCLLFAGAQNWLDSQEEHVFFGNGIVTADELSRMDLHSVQLVILSSCMSGMNDVIYGKEFHGLISAFSAAGVQYVITHLWSSPDFTTAILMDAFYYFYAEKKLLPPAALQQAKLYLRNITIGQLQQQGWLDKALYVYNTNCDMTELILSYKSSPASQKPFSSEAYWGGFSCYHCN